MRFFITIKNSGVDGTIRVTQRLLNQNIVVFENVIESGHTASAHGEGSPPRTFDWIHLATNLVGGPKDFGDGDTIDVES